MATSSKFAPCSVVVDFASVTPSPASTGVPVPRRRALRSPPTLRPSDQNKNQADAVALARGQSSPWQGIILQSKSLRIRGQASPRTERPAGSNPTGRPVDCLGLTKRWSLYVASTATPGFLTDLRQADPILNSPIVCRPHFLCRRR